MNSEDIQHSDIQHSIERRNLLSQFFVVLLLGLAYDGAIARLTESVRMDGYTFEMLVLFVCFLLTSLRFFIGAQFHLIDSRLLAMSGAVWFFDFFFIVLEMVVFALMGSVASVKASQEAVQGFYSYFILLLSIDVLWVILQWLLGVLMPSWQRQSPTWGWAIINTVTLVLISAVLWLLPNAYETGPLLFLGITCVVAFILDVFLYDYYGVMRPRNRRVTST